MGKQYDGIDGRLREFLLAQSVFFVATAPSGDDGHVNCSPKGMSGSFAVFDQHTVAYLDFTGSGVETVAHLRENGRIVLMFCAFDGPPKVVRLHGHGDVVEPHDARFNELTQRFSPVTQVGVRAVVLVTTTRISDSCGYGVPLMREVSERPLLAQWGERKGAQALATYHATRNATSIDGLPGLAAPL